MITIRQIQVAYDQLQDRLLVRIATPADEEYRVWISRRFLLRLWPHLAKLLGAPTMPVAASGPPAEPGSFEQPFRDEQATYPLGLSPLLASEIKLDALTDGGQRVTFREGRERTFQVALTPELLQAFCTMLRAAADTADWNLTLDYAADMPLPQLPAAVGPSRLH